MTAKQQDLRLSATLSMVVACVAVLCFVLDVYLLLSRHPAGGRLFRDVAYLPLYACAAYTFMLRYRHFSAQIADRDSSVDRG